SQDNQWRYDKLVLATGATPFIPPVPGRELMLTLNSQREYGAAQSQLHDAKRVLIVGGGDVLPRLSAGVAAGPVVQAGDGLA
ncbi:FAD-dependent oxidoreductase, partial [Acinetobacter baumannii]